MELWIVSGVGMYIWATLPPTAAACEAERAAWRWCSYGDPISMGGPIWAGDEDERAMRIR